MPSQTDKALDRADQADPAGAEVDPWDQPLDAETEGQIKSAEEKVRELEQKLSADTEAWMPHPGETLSGTVIAIDTRTSDYGAYPAITVQRLDGSELVFHAFRTVALNEVLRQKPKPGDLIAILYVGQVKGTDYHGYRVKIGGLREQDFDWSQFSEKKK